MGKEIHLSATAAVRRTLKGDTLSLSLQTNGVPLFQGLNPDTFTESPKWSESGTHPIITPSVGSARKNNVTLTNHAWAYNGKNLGFSSSGTGWETSTVDNRFKLNHANGSLSIIGDLASRLTKIPILLHIRVMQYWELAYTQWRKALIYWYLCWAAHLISEVCRLIQRY